MDADKESQSRQYEGAKTVIAINPDKDARIFEYADYGILEEF